MSIKDNLRRTEVAVAISTFKKKNLGRQIGNAALAAIKNGMDSREWKRYMALFCDTKEELERLTVERPGEDDYLPKLRAYIVANAVCASDTGTHTANGVVGNPEEDVDPPAGFVAAAGIEDPAVLRAELEFEIPQV